MTEEVSLNLQQGFYHYSRQSSMDSILNLLRKIRIILAKVKAEIGSVH